MTRKTIACAILALLGLVANAQRFDWAKGWEGPDNTDAVYGNSNYFSGTATDSRGNLYLLANYRGMDGGPYVEWDSVRLTPFNSPSDDGMVLARITPQGTMAWRKIVLSNGGSTYSHELRVLGDSAVACMFTYWPPFSEYSKLYYLDTLLTGIHDGYPATISGYSDYQRTALVIFDTAGNIVEHHTLHTARVGSGGELLRDSLGVVQNSPLATPSFDIDAEGNVYLLVNGPMPDGMCLLDDNRRVGVVDGWQGAAWSPSLLKFSPHLDTLLALRAVVGGNTSADTRYSSHIWVRLGVDGEAYAYGGLRRTAGTEQFDTLLIAPGLSHGCGYSDNENALLVKFDTALEAQYVVGIGEQVINAAADEYWHSGNLGSTFREVAFDADSGLLFVAGECWQRDANEPLRSAIYYVAGQPTDLVNHAYVLALDAADGSLHSIGKMPSMRQSNLGWDSRHVNWPYSRLAGLTVGGNRVLLQGVSIGGVYYPNLYRPDGANVHRLTMAQFDYAGHLVRGYDFKAISAECIPATLAVHDSMLYIANIISGGASFGNNTVQPEHLMACVALMVDTSLMSTYVYTEPEWIDTSNVNIVQVEEGATLVAYPNPFGKSVKIKIEGMQLMEGGGTVAAILTDLAGRSEAVRLASDGHGLYTLDMAGRHQAAYLLTLTSADGRQHSIRLLKQSGVFGQ